jgi:hypothetical protein
MGIAVFQRGAGLVGSAAGSAVYTKSPEPPGCLRLHGVTLITRVTRRVNSGARPSRGNASKKILKCGMLIGINAL